MPSFEREGAGMISRPIWTRLSISPAGCAFAVFAVAVSFASIAAGSPALYRASQKGQQFNPGDLSIHVGDTINIVNDDGDILHHAYIESSTFTFDSGDQEPGSTVAITFPVAGSFNVLCGIHPKMRMHVEVR